MTCKQYAEEQYPTLVKLMGDDYITKAVRDMIAEAFLSGYQECMSDYESCSLKDEI